MAESVGVLLVDSNVNNVNYGQHNHDGNNSEVILSSIFCTIMRCRVISSESHNDIKDPQNERTPIQFHIHHSSKNDSDDSSDNYQSAAYFNVSGPLSCASHFLVFSYQIGER